MASDRDLEEFVPLAEAVARSFARSFPECEEEDIRGELVLHLVERLAVMLEAFSRQEGPLAPAHGYVRRSLENRAIGYCQRIRANRLSESSQYVYRREDVMDAVQALARTGSPRDGMPDDYHEHVSKRDWSVDEDPSDTVVLTLDILDAWSRLSAPKKTAIRSHAEHDEAVQGAMAPALKASARRAYDSLVLLMNTNYPRAFDAGGPGSRPVISNDRARAQTSSDYE